MTRYERKRAFCARVAKTDQLAANGKRIAKNTLVLYVRMLAVMIVGLYTGRVFLEALGVDDYGLQNIAGSVVALFAFINSTLATGTSRFLTVEMGKGTRGSLKRVFSTTFYVHLIVALFCVVLMESIGLSLLETKLNIDPSRIGAVKWLYHCSVITMFFSMTQVPYNAAIIAHERMSAFGWMAIYDVIVKLFIAMAISHYGGDRLVLNGTLWFASGIFTFLVYRIYCYRNFTEARIRRVFDKGLLKPIFSFAGWYVGTQIVIILITQGVTMLNQRYFGPALVAALAVANTVNAHVQGFISNFKTAANPQIIKLYAAQKYKDAKLLLTDTVLFSVYLLLLIGLPVWFYSDEALSIWLGETVPQWSPVMVKIILFGAFFSLFDASLYVILYAAGRIRENMIFNTIGGLLVFAGIYATIHFSRNPLASVVWLAANQVLLGCVYKPILLHYIAGYTLKDFGRIFAPSFMALVSCSLVAWIVKWVMPSSLRWAIPSCAMVFALNCAVIYCFFTTQSQKQAFRAIVGRVVPAFKRWCE